MGYIEINEAIAETVFGPKPTEIHKSWHLYPKYSDNKGWVCHPNYESGDKCEWEALLFSTDASLALRAINLYANGNWFMEYNDNEFFVMINEDVDNAVTDSEMAMAICSAIMKNPKPNSAQMNPGSELDTLVWMELRGRSLSDVKLRRVEDRVQIYEEGKWISPPPYSTNIERAFSVLEKLHRSGTAHISVSNGDGDSYDCDLVLGQPYDVMGGASGETWSHAICLAVVDALRRRYKWTHLES